MNRIRGVYLIADAGTLHPDRLVEVVERVLPAGVQVLQLRDKAGHTARRVDLAGRLLPLARSMSILFLINDDVEAARQAGADGVHLGAEDLDLHATREILGPSAVIGASAGTPEEAQAAEAGGADYLGVGPAYPTTTKPDAGRPIGPEGVRAVKEATSLPVVAIGGITLDNASDLLRAGADAIAVISAVLNAPDPIEATKKFAALFQTTTPPDASRS